MVCYSPAVMLPKICKILWCFSIISGWFDIMVIVFIGWILYFNRTSGFRVLGIRGRVRWYQSIRGLGNLGSLREVGSDF